MTPPVPAVPARRLPVRGLGLHRALLHRVQRRRRRAAGQAHLRGVHRGAEGHPHRLRLPHGRGRSRLRGGPGRLLGRHGQLPLPRLHRRQRRLRAARPLPEEVRPGSHLISHNPTSLQITSPHLRSLLDSPHLTSSLLISPDLTSSNLTSPHPTPPHLASPPGRSWGTGPATTAPTS